MAHRNRLCRTLRERERERELELNGLEASDEMQIKTVTQKATLQNPEKLKLTCLATTAKNQVTVETSAVNSNAEKSKTKTIKIVPAIAILLVFR